MKIDKFKIGLMLMIVMLLGACTRNDGAIGLVHGMWRVTEILQDGVKNESYSGTVYFLFQSSVYSQKYVDEFTHGHDNRMALWHYEGDDVVLHFTDQAPLSITGMQVGENYVTIDECNHDNMTMSYVTPKGVIYVYKLKKW